jgi:hypothetical protein
MPDLVGYKEIVRFSTWRDWSELGSAQQEEMLIRLLQTGDLEKLYWRKLLSGEPSKRDTLWLMAGRDGGGVSLIAIQNK